MDTFSPVAKSAWSTDDGARHLLRPDGVRDPRLHLQQGRLCESRRRGTEDGGEFFAALDKIKKDGTYVPMAMGTADQWEAATMGYQNIGPNYWHGEDGRKALVAGKEKLTDADWVAPYQDAGPLG